MRCISARFGFTMQELNIVPPQSAVGTASIGGGLSPMSVRYVVEAIDHHLEKIGKSGLSIVVLDQVTL